MAEIKTKPTSESVEEFINSIKDDQKRKDSYVLLEMMKKASGEEPKMWGSSIILNLNEAQFLSEQYDGCLCASCLKEIKAEYKSFLDS